MPRKKETGKKLVGFNCDIGLLERLHANKERTGVSLEWQINQAVAAFLLPAQEEK